MNRPHSPRRRRGNYSILVGVMVPVFFGFMALSVDISFMVMAETQAQFAADAAAHAAYVKFRVAQDEQAGNASATAILAENTIAGGAAHLDDINYGRWDGASFSSGGANVNAVQLDVSRAGDSQIPFFFARFLGYDTFPVSAASTVSGRKREMMIAQDVTGSFIDDIGFAEQADVAFLDFMIADNFPGDAIGLTVWQRAVPDVITTPLTEIETSGAAIRAQWLGIEEQHGHTWLWPFAIAWCDYLGAYPGTDDCPDDPEVIQGNQTHGGHQLRGGVFHGTNYGAGYGQCYNAVTSCFSTIGTRPGVGLRDSVDHLLANGDNDSFKAIVLVSDGLPNYAGDYGEAEGEANRAWDNDIHLWTVTYENGGGDFTWMTSLARGLGTGYLAPSAAELEGIMIEIAASIPVVTVR